MTNLIKNAVESFDNRDRKDNESDHIAVVSLINDGDLMIGVADNGPGLPKDIESEKLTEPYITHKAKGTGLGLAIVKKIIEDHHGELLFNPDVSIINEMNFDVSTLIAFTLPLERS